MKGLAGNLSTQLPHIPEWRHILSTLSSRDTYLNLLTHLVIILLIWLGAWLLIRIAQALVQRLMQPLLESDLRKNEFHQAARRRTLISLFLSVARYTLSFFAVIGILATWNVHFVGLLSAALGTAGILGVVVGFGAQKLVRDVITGFFILMEDQYSVGDTVTIGVITGVVEEVGIRVTKIRDDIGRINMMPNGDISLVTNHSRGGLSAAVDLSVGPDQDLAAVREVVAHLSKKCESSDGDVVSPVAVQGMTALDGTKVTMRIVATAAPGRQKAAEMELRAALREGFLAAGVKLV
ncbi:MAG TPA: mechanosensitive ion channel family protein [Armatimonadota bacterium]|nr:mechanosensitive ion channel family protein [Armatimonadota bacterium]